MVKLDEIECVSHVILKVDEDDNGDEEEGKEKPSTTGSLGKLKM